MSGMWYKDGSCVADCGAHWFVDYLLEICVECPDECTGCDFLDSCTGCIDGYYLNYMQQCVKCADNCESCDEHTCLVCATDFFID